MFPSTGNAAISTTTSYKVVLPYYLYAALAFLAANILLAFSGANIAGHYFQPHTLAITHIMALGWGTMIILGASHQLVPVLIEGSLYSEKLAFISFLLAAIGIPLLVYGFYSFNMGWPAETGGSLFMISIVCYLLNVAKSMAATKRRSIHAIFIFTSALWLLATIVLGLLLVCNFSYSFLPAASIHYLALHAHLGIIGWFLLLVTGVGSRLIPLFLISKYENKKQLWIIYSLINGGLLLFVCMFLYGVNSIFYFLPVIMVATAIVLFGSYCNRAWKQRIRKKLDEPMQVSMLSVLMMLLPAIFMVVIICILAFSKPNQSIAISYGFIIFFGWVTAIIFGMTFKTLPFIIWNKVYHRLAGKQKTPNPKDLFSSRVFTIMSVVYLAGFVAFIAGILLNVQIIIRGASFLLLATAILYNWNVIKLLLHKPAFV
jgi:hypothetical protein